MKIFYLKVAVGRDENCVEINNNLYIFKVWM